MEFETLKIWNLKAEKYVNVTGAKAQIVPSRLPLVKLNKVKVDQVRLTQFREGEKVMELTSSSSREHFILTIRIVNGNPNGRWWLNLNEEQRSENGWRGF